MFHAIQNFAILFATITVIGATLGFVLGSTKPLPKDKPATKFAKDISQRARKLMADD